MLQVVSDYLRRIRPVYERRGIWIVSEPRRRTYEAVEEVLRARRGHRRLSRRGRGK